MTPKSKHGEKLVFFLRDCIFSAWAFCYESVIQRGLGALWSIAHSTRTQKEALRSRTELTRSSNRCWTFNNIVQPEEEPEHGKQDCGHKSDRLCVSCGKPWQINWSTEVRTGRAVLYWNNSLDLNKSYVTCPACRTQLITSSMIHLEVEVLRVPLLPFDSQQINVSLLCSC